MDNEITMPDSGACWFWDEQVCGMNTPGHYGSDPACNASFKGATFLRNRCDGQSIQLYRTMVPYEDPCDPLGEIGVLEPTNEDNCTKLKTYSSNPIINSSLEDLKNKAELVDKEYGYSYRETADGIVAEDIRLTQSPPFSEVEQNAFSVPFPKGLNAVAVSHTHPNDYQGYLMFSPEDIFYFYNIAKRHVSEGAKDYSNYTLSLVTHQGTYALKIENMSLFLYAMSVKYDKVFRDNLIFMYQEREPMDPISHFEKDFLKYIGQNFGQGNLGISLYKSNDDLTIWSKLELNDNNNNIDSDDVSYVPCNN